MKTMLIAIALMAFSTQAFALGAITPRPDCPVIQSDPADINHPVTYNCANPMRDAGAEPCNSNIQECKSCGKEARKE